MLERALQYPRLLLTGTCLLLCWIGYHFAFSKTLEAWQLHGKLTAQTELAGDLSRQPAYLVRKDSNLRRLLRGYRADTLAFRNSKVSQIAAIAESNHVRLSEVPPDDQAYHAGRQILQRLDFEGSFFDLTRTLDRLEHTADIGVIRSLNYRTIKDPVQSEKKRLVLELYFEMLK